MAGLEGRYRARTTTSRISLPFCSCVTGDDVVFARRRHLALNNSTQAKCRFENKKQTDACRLATSLIATALPALLRLDPLPYLSPARAWAWAYGGCADAGLACSVPLAAFSWRDARHRLYTGITYLLFTGRACLRILFTITSLHTARRATVTIELLLRLGMTTRTPSFLCALRNRT